MQRSLDDLVTSSAAPATTTGAATVNMSRRSITRYLGYGSLLAAAAAVAPPSRRADAQTELTQEEGTSLTDRIVGRFNAGDVEGLGSLFAPDVAVHFPWPIPGSGVAYVGGIVQLARSVVPDATMAIDDLTIAGDRIIAITTIRGTQTGSTFGLPATGTELNFAAIFVARIVDGKIAEIWGQFDGIAVGLQLAGAQDSVVALLGTLLNPTSAVATPVAGRTLDDLLAVPGVSFVLEFAPDGSVVDYRSEIDIPQGEIDQAAKAGPTLNSAVALAATRYNDISVLGWDPPKWLVYSGGDKWSAVLSGNHALITETATTDFNALAAALGVTA